MTSPRPSAPPRFVDGGGDAADRHAADLLSQVAPARKDDLARERVWRRLTSEHTRTASRFPLFALSGGVTAALVAGVLAWGWMRPRTLAPPARVTVLSTSGEVAHVTGDRAHAGETLATGDILQTADGAHATVGLPQGVLALNGGSSLEVESMWPVRLALDRGSLTADARHGALAVVAKGWELLATVALFSVRVAGETIVEVSSGEVEVHEGAQRWRVGQGEAWRSGAPGVRRQTSELAAEQIAQLDGAVVSPDASELRVEGDRAYAISLDGMALGHAPVSALALEGPHRVRASANGRQLELEASVRRGEPAIVRIEAPPAAPAPQQQAPAALAPTSEQPEAGAATTAPQPVAPTVAHHQRERLERIRAQHEEPLVVAMVERPRPAAPKATAPQQEPLFPPAASLPPLVAPLLTPQAVTPAPLLVAPLPAPQTPTPSPLPDDRYSEALALERSGRATDAEAMLRHVVGERAPHSELALYELGSLHQHQLGDLAAARADFATYRAEYPSGALSQEAALSAIEVELALKERSGALAAIDDFLARYPHNERATSMRLIRANLRREASDWKGALGDYQELLDTSYGSEALFLRACCQREAGDVPGAERSLRDYLERYPTGEHRAEAERALNNR